jgi:predicted ribonuclease YlaK
MLKNPDITVKLITGTWGTGKTLALVVAALEAVQRGEFDKIIWVRNNV